MSGTGWSGINISVGTQRENCQTGINLTTEIIINAVYNKYITNI